MNDPLYERLRETGWRRPLTPSEEAELSGWLAAHPEAQADWEAEQALNEVMERLPEAPVSSNFTARVLQTVERESSATRKLRPSRWTWRWLAPRAALAALAICLGLFTYDRDQAARRADLARKVAVVSGVAAIQNPEVLQDFETIRRLGQTPKPDEELLALLQ